MFVRARVGWAAAAGWGGARGWQGCWARGLEEVQQLLGVSSPADVTLPVSPPPT